MDYTFRGLLGGRNRYTLAVWISQGIPVVINSAHKNLKLRLRRVVPFMSVEIVSKFFIRTALTLGDRPQGRLGVRAFFRVTNHE